MTKRKRTYSTSELAEVADGLRRLLDAIAEGSMVAGASTTNRIEGALAALDALAAGGPVDFGQALAHGQSEP